MTQRRIKYHPVLEDLTETRTVTFQFDGETYEGHEGDTIASALLASGVRTLRKHESSGNPRGIYCNIGHCFECRVTVNEEPNVRACLTPIRENMVVESGQVQPRPLDPSEDTAHIRTYEDFKTWKEE